MEPSPFQLTYSFGYWEYKGGRGNLGEYVLDGRGSWPVAKRLILSVDTYANYEALRATRQC